MIKMSSPSVVINAHDVPGPKYRMCQTVDADEGVTAAQAVEYILTANQIARNYANKPLQNVIINCHGSDLGMALYIGGQDHDRRGGGIRKNTVGHFARLKPLHLGTFWLVACQASATSDGKELCQRLADTAGVQVVASELDQEVGIVGGYHLYKRKHYDVIDEFEGPVYAFNPSAPPRRINPHTDIFTIRGFEPTDLI
jgi:hypothetical protein